MASGDSDSDRDPPIDDDDSDGDFFTAKDKLAKDEKREEEEDAEESKKLPNLSKRALRKIKPEGHYDGKNKMTFDAEGKVVVPKSDFDSVYMQQLRDPDGKIKLQRDDEVSEDEGARDVHTAKMKKKLAENLEVDTKIAKEKRKEKKLKLKKRLRAENGLADKDDEPVFTLGDPNAESEESENDAASYS